MVKQQNQINQVMRNGLVDIQYKAQSMGRLIDDMLKRCKQMEEALDAVEAEHKEEQRKAFRAEL